MAHELLDRYKTTLINRRVRLEAAHMELNEEKQSNMKLNPHKLEDKRLFLEKEELNLEQLGLNIKTGKRLIKQKKFQLNLLEKNLMGHDNNKYFNDSDLSHNESDDEAKMPMNKFSFQNNSNLTELIHSLKNTQSKSELKGLYEQKLHPILKKIPKLNKNLEIMLENINSGLQSENFGSKANSYKNEASLIDEKWKKYLNESVGSNRKVNYFQDTIMNSDFAPNRNENSYFSTKNASSTVTNGWENSPAYHKLTYESGTRLLDEKWNQYMGDSINSTKNMSRTLNSMKPSNSLNSLNNRFSNATTVTLPESTKQRLNNHRDWLKRFKADGQTSMNHSNLIENTSDQEN